MEKLMSLARTISIAFLTALSLAAAPTSQPAFLAPDHFDFKALLGEPPAEDSQQHSAEVDQLLMLQAHRTPIDEARCKSEEEVTVFAFATVLGQGFNEDDLPKTAALMAEVNKQAKIPTNAAKNMWRRVRPPLADPRIHTCVTLEKTPSYPSGHAMRGMLWATLLSEIFPAQRAALMARGKQIGDDRFLAGMHYPSDVVAGQKLGAEIARRFLADEDFKARFAVVKSECLAQSHVAR
jgi:acid phosphatase (class A)